MSIIEQAETELNAIKFGDSDTRVILDILRIFFHRFNSGGAVSVAAPVLMRCLAGVPLTQLTGAAAEWHCPDPSMPDLWQNVRCSHVFAIRNTVGEFTYYDANLPAPEGKRFREITFPYDVPMPEWHAPVYEVKT